MQENSGECTDFTGYSGEASESAQRQRRHANALADGGGGVAGLEKRHHHFTRLLSLKIGRMIDIAMKPTTLPMITIISGSIIAVTLLMTAFSSRP
jgi:hypothetical protein